MNIMKNENTNLIGTCDQATPGPKTGTDSLLQDIDRLLQKLHALRDQVHRNSGLFAQFGTASSISVLMDEPNLYLFDALDPKAFCRTVGGNWKRELKEKGSFHYTGNFYGVNTVIFNAEKTQETDVVL